MKKKKLLFLLPVTALLLGGCVDTKRYPEKDYVVYLPWDKSEDFKVLQLGDIHLSQSDKYDDHFAVIDRTIKAADPNLIVLNGDIFTFADKHVVNKLFSFIESHNIYWTFTFGNHDDQGYYSDTYIQSILTTKKYPHVRFIDHPDDDVTGRSNFVINLREGNDNSKALYQFYFLDSHSYNFDTFKYDYIKQDQIDWYERMVIYSKDNFGEGTVVPSSMYIHIGTPEFTKIWDQSKTKDEQNYKVVLGNMEEWGGSPEEDLGFLNKIKELGSTKSIGVNHDHANDSVVDYDGVYLCYGVHSTNRIYTDKNGVKIGGSVLKIDKNTKKLSFKNYYTSYSTEEVTSIPEGEGWAE